MHLARPVLDPSPIPWLAARVGRCRVERPFSAVHGPLFPVRPLYFLHVFGDTSKGTAGTSSFLLCAPRPQRRRRGVVQLGTHGESWEGRLGCRRGGHLSGDRCGSGHQPCPAPDVSSGWLLLPAVAAGPRPPARPPSRGGGERRACFPHRFRVSPQSRRARPPQEETPSVFPAACVWRPPGRSTIPAAPSSGVDPLPRNSPHWPGHPPAHEWASHPSLQLPFSAPSYPPLRPPPLTPAIVASTHSCRSPLAAAEAVPRRRGQGLPLPLNSHPQAGAVFLHLLVPWGGSTVPFRDGHLPISPQPSAATNHSPVTTPACA